MIDGTMKMRMAFTDENKCLECDKMISTVMNMKNLPSCECDMFVGCGKLINCEPDIWVVDVECQYNRNFSFQLARLPLFIIPEPWKLSPEECEAKIKEVNANGKWVIDNFKELARKYSAAIVMNEHYDSTAEGEYKYCFYHKSGTEIDVDYAVGKPDYDTALCKQITLTKLLCKQLKGRLHPHPWCDYLYE